MTQEIQPVTQGYPVDPWPPITVLIITYNRPELIRRTIDAYREHLRYDGELIWRLADDGSPPGYLEDLAADYPELDLKWAVTDRLGLGSNANKGLKACETKYVFFTEDDLVCTRSIDLVRGMTVLENVPQIAIVSFDMPAIGVTLHVRYLKVAGGNIRYFIRDHASKYWYTGHPHLMHRRFHEFYGYFEEGANCGRTETTFGGRVRTMKGGPEIAILPAYVGKRPYGHIGYPRLKGSVNDAGR